MPNEDMHPGLGISLTNTGEGGPLQHKLRAFCAGCIALSMLTVMYTPAHAAPDEIQVYLDDIRAPGET